MWEKIFFKKGKYYSLSKTPTKSILNFGRRSLLPNSPEGDITGKNKNGSHPEPIPYPSYPSSPRPTLTANSAGMAIFSSSNSDAASLYRSSIACAEARQIYSRPPLSIVNNSMSSFSRIPIRSRMPLGIVTRPSASI